MTPMLPLLLQQRLQQHHKEMMPTFYRPIAAPIRIQLPVQLPILPNCQINHLSLTEPTPPLHRRHPYNLQPHRTVRAALVMQTVIMHL